MSAGNMKTKSRSDWERINAMKDEDIDLSESPELDAAFFKEAVVWPTQKKQITLRLDPDILDFFKSQGRGYQTAINKVLRRYVEAQKQH
jgi:uncharacterized protein (DUF4415 family)